MIENFIDRFVPSKDEREFLKDKSVTFSDVEQAEIIINHECLKNSEKKQAVQELKETISDKELITDLNKAIDEIPDSENCWHESGMKCFYRKFDIPHNFRHGDIVRVVDGKHEGNIGVILGLTDEEYEKLKVKRVITVIYRYVLMSYSEDMIILENFHTRMLIQYILRESSFQKVMQGNITLIILWKHTINSIYQIIIQLHTKKK